MTKSENRVVLATGGTGGHIFPAQALAHELEAQNYKVIIFTDNRGEAFSRTKLPLVKIRSSSLSGGLLAKVAGCFSILMGYVMALYYLSRIKPKVVVGFGGYASFPTMLAAATLRYPTMIHQADAFFGRTNRFLARWITKICTSFPYVENVPRILQKKVVLTGLPIRSGIQTQSYPISKNDEPFHLLVTGGSQGARVFSEIVPRAIQKLPQELQRRLCITQQCRQEFLEKTKQLYQKTKAKVQLTPFIKNMGEEYQMANLIISRSGASSVTEASIVGRPALFVPYPFAMDDHQFYNAQQVVNAKGGWLIRERDFTSAKLAEMLDDLMRNSQKLEEAAANIRSVASQDATLRLAHVVRLIAA